ncbi:DUF2306 domain-containing protein [Bacillus sp. 1P10SD]|uniref:DUF2306 domain-containing protein n=1 Tax=Bacillus sp. 1P10SD TaxID=3132265 RepID=UPI0039A653A8
MKKIKQKTGWITLFVMVFLFIAYVLIQYFIVSPKESGVVQGKLATPHFPYRPWIGVLYVHIVAGCTAFIIGPFQFFKKPVGKGASLHRKLGYIYVLSILFAGVAGMYLCWYATGGIISGLGFFMLDLLWLVTTGIALRMVLQKKFAAHRRWMIRSYAVTFAFVTFRLYLLPFTLLLNLSIQTAIQMSSWLCWITNLLLIELLLRRKTVNAKTELHITRIL